MRLRQIDAKPAAVACCTENHASHEVLAQSVSFSLFEPVWSRPRPGFLATYRGVSDAAASF